MNSSAIRRFYKLCLSTLIAVYFLVLVGGIVRSTGSGMGCPDWPTCFGRLVPPTSVDQLPKDYKDQYAAYREKKNQKFARYLSMMGFQSTADKLLNDKTVLVEADFNAARTWVEYINRVVGVIIGLLIVALFLVSFQTRSLDPTLFKGALATLILVLFQGWFGSIVVSTNLTAWTVTVHMFMALLIVAVLIWLLVRSSNWSQPASGVKYWFLGGMAILLIQIFLGTQVRETLDLLALSLPRDQWIANAGTDFVIHRSFSWSVLIVQAVLWYKLRKSSKKSLSLVPLILILLSLLTGSAMALWAVPGYLQPVHLLLAVVTFGWFYQAYLLTSSTQHG